jgi:hypothetical protein
MAVRWSCPGGRRADGMADNRHPKEAYDIQRICVHV